ncbi:nuclear transport factor 2 family protein [Chitinimonas sp. BJB300]|uniref:nuclear transport factor 2 family protein n=1 Tax=Chitinimonas sp. BJB300 TaxID=1559339 RepID=UPI000C10075E|nr:DUF4440 domain-containing protein [Chitinimonas sp. BJB300]PHV10731.1 DUF4440 domain-containing protein [Chitinimonas sp. BJB300]TSJ91233.1 DUF4440 domain-containing protein [Chitinimonas sp. BJB300]
MNTSADEIIKLESRLLAPGVRLSAAELDTLIADDFLEHGSSGRAFGKGHVLARLPGEQGTTFIPSVFCVRFLASDVALVTYRLEMRIANELDAVFSLRSSVWRCNEVGWQMIFHQGTRTSSFAADD